MVGYLKGKSTMIIFERFSPLRRNFKGNSFWARGYYVNTVGLDEAKIRRYIKNQQLNEYVEDEYNSDTDKDPFKGASNKEEDSDK
jgi:putative transposase